MFLPILMDTLLPQVKTDPPFLKKKTNYLPEGSSLSRVILEYPQFSYFNDSEARFKKTSQENTS